MRAGDVAIATVTWARTAAEEALLHRSLDVLTGLGLPVAIADRGASASFSRILGTLPHATVVTPSESGLVAQALASLAAAAATDRQFILYVEPDKHFFHAHRLLPFIDSVPGDPQPGVAIVSRTARSFHTFPPTQQYTEGVANHLCGQLIGSRGDYMYGPFLLNRALLPTLDRMDRSLGWGWRPYAFLTAQRLGYAVLHLEDDCPCAPDQQAEDESERLHRLRQLSQNVMGLVAAAAAPVREGES